MLHPAEYRDVSSSTGFFGFAWITFFLALPQSDISHTRRLPQSRKAMIFVSDCILDLSCQIRATLSEIMIGEPFVVSQEPEKMENGCSPERDSMNGHRHVLRAVSFRSTLLIAALVALGGCAVSAEGDGRCPYIAPPASTRDARVPLPSGCQVARFGTEDVGMVTCSDGRVGYVIDATGSGGF